MNEFKERHEIARLIGAPPGFVGHDQPGAIFRHVDSNPRGVVLLDEMEKSHPEIQDYFLQLFDKGEARDTHGRAVDFRNQLFVMTCNVAGAGEANREVGFHGGDPRRKTDVDRGIRSHLREYFRDEFIGRVDAVIPFASLDKSDFNALFERNLEGLQTRLAEKYDRSLQATNDVRNGLADRAVTLGEGARGFQRMFKEFIEQPLFELARASDATAFTLQWLEDGVVILTGIPGNASA
jgi:ATP-dependent Clp protease ATP-binding subunit ClpA